jgi:ribosome-binding factor A
MNQARERRVSEAITQIVAEMLERRVKDPRLGFVTVTGTRLTGDLREATVFYTVYGTADERAETAAALASAAGLIRSEVGRQTGIKHTPSISFQPDAVPDNARNIEELVARARDADAALAAARAGARHAGDADPYRPTSGDAADKSPAGAGQEAAAAGAGQGGAADDAGQGGAADGADGAGQGGAAAWPPSR